MDDVPTLREILLAAWKKEVAQNLEQDPLRILYPPTKNDGPFVRLQRSADCMKDRRARVEIFNSRPRSTRAPELSDF